MTETAHDAPGSRRWVRRAVPLLGLVALSTLGFFAVRWLRGGPDPALIWEQAITAFEVGRHAEAEAGLEQLARLRPPTPREWGLRARLAMARDQTEPAIGHLRKVPDDHALGSWAHLRIGQLELRRNRLREAERELRRALELDPGVVEARRELIYLFGVQMRRRELDAAFEALAAREPLTFREVWIWCMVPDLIWWIPEENQVILRRAIAADPGDRWSRLALAENLRRLARYDEAAKILEPLPTDDPEAVALRAQLALEQGDPAGAHALVDPRPLDEAAVSRLKGRLAMAEGRPGEAVKAFERAQAAEPDRRDSAADLGRALMASGQGEQARPYLERSERLDALAALLLRAEQSKGSDLDLLRELGAACEAVDRRPEARAWFALVIARQPLDRAAQEALFRLGPKPPPPG